MIIEEIATLLWNKSGTSNRMLSNACCALTEQSSVQNEGVSFYIVYENEMGILMPETSFV